MFNLSNNQKKKIWCVDNFYEDPLAVRQFALQQDYHHGGIGRGYIGRRTFKQFLFPGLKERFEEIMGIKITKWEEHDMNGRFQTAYAGEPLVYHCDDQLWAAAIYLTPDAPPESGTTLWRHKKNKMRHKTEMHSGPGGYPFDKGFLDKTPFEPVDVIGNVFNRLVIWDAGSIHSASQYFGTKNEDSRLFQIFFFD
jgi:hypothetical protein